MTDRPEDPGVAGAPADAGQLPLSRAVWTRTKEVLGEVLEQPAERRLAYAQQRCAGDAALLEEVKTFLAAAEDPHPLLAGESLPSSVLADAVLGAPVQSGSVVGKYRIGAALGTGGMGSVFLATDEQLNRRVAVKFLNAALASTGARRRFEAEARMLARLDHPGVARIYEAGLHHSPGHTADVPFFAMEYVEGARTLDAYVKEARPNLRALCELFAYLCDAVHHGHQKGVLHRDIKPTNVLVDSHARLKVIDFGVALLAEQRVGGKAGAAGEVLGTLAYLPPEAFEHGAVVLDTRADVYALGVVLYELLAGRCPFAGSSASPLSLGATVCGSPPPPLGSVRPDCRGEVEAIVAKAMARAPSERYQSAAELGADLRRYLAYEPIAARPTPLLRQARLFARRNRVLVGTSGVVLLALTTSIVGLAAGFASARASERKAKEQASKATQVSSFVMQMLRSASPWPDSPSHAGISMDPDSGASAAGWRTQTASARAPTVGELLGAAADHLESAFPDDIGVQADMAAILAQTGHSLSDPRSGQLAGKAASLLARAYGPDDRRTMIARQHVYGYMLADGDTSLLDDMARDLDTLLSRIDPSERPLLRQAWSSHVKALELRAEFASAIARTLAVRAALERASSHDDPFKLVTDLAVVRLQHYRTNPREGLRMMPDLLARAARIEPTPGDATCAVLFAMQEYQVALGDHKGAIATLAKGVEVAAQHFGDKTQSTYEWWTAMHFAAMQCGDFDTAVRAGERQAEAAEAMLGPYSSYTIKAQGRLARALLAQGLDPARAERAARKALDGAPEQLAAGDGWQIYHELLYAWAIRAQGDPERALRMIQDRVHAEARARRVGVIDWVEILRATQIVECALDIAEHTGDSPFSPEQLHALLREAECYGDMMGREWPSVRLVERARARFESVQGRVP